MRNQNVPARKVLWSVIVLALLSGRGMAQAPTTFPAEMTVIVPEVEVRSGPAMKCYPTSKLFQGQHVTIVKQSDQPGWVAIKPPPGSFTWIREKFVKKVDARTGFVQAPDNGTVMVKAASLLIEDGLDRETEKVPSGCQVMFMDDKVYERQKDSERWLAIQPIPGELRYLPMSALRVPAPPVQVVAGFPTTVGGDPLARADQARAAGNVELARQLYREAADRLPEPQKSRAQNSLASLPPPPAGTTAPVAASHSNWQPVNAQGGNPAQVPPLGAGQIGGATQSISNHNVSGPTMTNIQPAQWSGWGYLRRAGFEKDGQSVYVLEDNKKQPMMYAVEKPGAVPVLDKMIGRAVCLYGPIQYRSEDFPRINYMVVTYYTPLAYPR